MEKHDFMTTAPRDERCAQLGDEEYSLNSIYEAETLIAQLTNEFGDTPGESFFGIAQHEHDFGNYRTVYYCYSDSDDEYDYLQELEDNFPREWTESSKSKLKELGHSQIE